MKGELETVDLFSLVVFCSLNQSEARRDATSWLSSSAASAVYNGANTIVQAFYNHVWTW